MFLCIQFPTGLMTQMQFCRSACSKAEAKAKPKAKEEKKPKVEIKDPNLLTELFLESKWILNFGFCIDHLLLEHTARTPYISHHMISFPRCFKQSPCKGLLIE